MIIKPLADKDKGLAGLNMDDSNASPKPDLLKILEH
jgi:hypothetical protein